MNAIVLMVYGLILIAGGLMGAKAGSKVSLAAGSISGIFVFIGLWMAAKDSSLGYGFLSALTVLLSVMFLVRWIKTKKLMPSGILLMLSLLAAGVAVLSLTGRYSFMP